MAAERLEDRIERLSEALLLADINDLPHLFDIASDMDAIAEVAAEKHLDEVTASASAAAEILRSVANGEAQHAPAALDVVNRTVAALQALVCENCKLDEVDFPEEVTSRPATGETPAAEKVGPVVNETTKKEPEPVASESALNMDFDLLQAFVVEATEHLDAIEEHLLTLETQPDNEESVHAIFRGFHTIKGAAAFMDLTQIRTLSHELEDLLTKIRNKSIIVDDQVIDVTLNGTDHLKTLVGGLRETLTTHVLPEPSKILQGYLDAIRSVVSGEEAKEIIETPSRLQEEVVQSTESTQPRICMGDTIRVDAERLDRVLDAIGELVIVESMVSQSEELKGAVSQELDRRLVQLDKITRSLHEMSTSLRMVPIRPVFLKMARLARDAARTIGKEIDFSMSGEDTELDKAVVDQLADPLTHLIRNAIDHGIESSPEERRKNGKLEAGRITLRAFHRGGNIYVEVEDDGLGMDREAILARSKERGIIFDDANFSDRDAFDLVFAPGFSTAKEVTLLSGRGVGMDVVKRNVENLRGTIAITSTRNRGCTVSIRLPLTLAIIDGMIVRVGEERYIIPKLSIVRCIRPKAEDLSTIVGQAEVLMVDGASIPMFRLQRLFGTPGARQDPTQALIVIIEDNERRTALMVDSLIGQQQIVIKSIGDQLGNIRGISGGGIMSDGTVGLVMDVSGLVKLAHAAPAANEPLNRTKPVMPNAEELMSTDEEKSDGV